MSNFTGQVGSKTTKKIFEGVLGTANIELIAAKMTASDLPI